MYLGIHTLSLLIKYHFEMIYRVDMPSLEEVQITCRVCDASMEGGVIQLGGAIRFVYTWNSAFLFATE